MYETILDDFSSWMSTHRVLSQSTIGKYTRAVKVVSREMIDSRIINKSLLNMSLSELDIAISLITKNNRFIEKNKKGNHMYSNGLKQYRFFISDINDSVDENEEAIIESIKTDKSIKDTEKSSIVKSRIGQGDFRKALFKKYNGQCLVTGIDLDQLLIASHIKPWCVSDNRERLSSENGLLLIANYDKLFDNGLISFKKDGTMLISSVISNANKKKLGLSSDVKVELKASTEMLQNLEYHQDVIFIE